MKNKVGLVLEGGGAKGAYHLGAYKALYEIGYRFSGIAGTSVGALNGALIAQGEWKKTYDLWYNSSNKQIYGIDDTERATGIITDVIKNKGIKTDNMKDIFFSIIDEKKLRKSKIELGIVTVKLPGFKTIEVFKDEIPKGELKSYLMASANFPLFKREENKDGVFIDGALKNNLPLNMLPKRGYKELVAIRTFGMGRVQHFNNSGVHVTSIEPSKNLGPTLDFDKNRTRANLLLGYFDTYKKIKGYIGKDFCIKPFTEDLSYINQMLHMADEQILKASKVMGYENVNPKRFMFEKLLPQVAEYLHIGIDTSYETLILTFFEEIAKVTTLDRNKIYKANEFIKEVRHLFFKEHGQLNKYEELPKIIQNSVFLSSFVKNDFFQFIMDIFFH